MTIIAILYGVMSLVTFVAYGVDKSRAVHGRWRVSERTLHGLELIGGWPGAILGQAVFRHKCHKLSYMVVFTGIVALHVAAWVIWYRQFRAV